MKLLALPCHQSVSSQSRRSSLTWQPCSDTARALPCLVSASLAQTAPKPERRRAAIAACTPFAPCWQRSHAARPAAAACGRSGALRLARATAARRRSLTCRLCRAGRCFPAWLARRCFLAPGAPPRRCLPRRSAPPHSCASWRRRTRAPPRWPCPTFPPRRLGSTRRRCRWRESCAAACWCSTFSRSAASTACTCCPSWPPRKPSTRRRRSPSSACTRPSLPPKGTTPPSAPPCCATASRTPCSTTRAKSCGTRCAWTRGPRWRWLRPRAA